MTDSTSYDKETIGVAAINGSTHYDGKLFHLDDGGIYFESNEIVEPGDEISITVRKLNNSKITFDVEILWRKEFYNEAFSYGYGVRSINPKDVLKQV